MRLLAEMLTKHGMLCAPQTRAFQYLLCSIQRRFLFDASLSHRIGGFGWFELMVLPALRACRHFGIACSHLVQKGGEFLSAAITQETNFFVAHSSPSTFRCRNRHKGAFQLPTFVEAVIVWLCLS